MVRSPIDQLKADAFVLSKLLAERHVKLSSQQCLDVLARLRTSKPYEALAAQGLSDAPGKPGKGPEGSVIPLFDWLTCGTELKSLLATLNRTEIRKASMLTMGSVDGVQADKKRRYIRASAVALEMFTRSAEAFVRQQFDAFWCVGLDFKVETLDPIGQGGIGKIIISPTAGSRPTTIREESNGPRFEKHRHAGIHGCQLEGEMAFMLWPTSAAYAAGYLDEQDECGELELEPGARSCRTPATLRRSRGADRHSGRGMP